MLNFRHILYIYTAFVKMLTCAFNHFPRAVDVMVEIDLE